MDDDIITTSMRREVAHYLSMLLGDQLLEFNEGLMTEYIQLIRSAYEHVNEEIERALAMPRTQGDLAIKKTTPVAAA
jgi:hypothetical protein